MVDLQWVFAERPKIETERWEWPAAVYRGPSMRHAAYLICEDAYHEVLVRSDIYKEISVLLLRYNYPGQHPLTPRRMLYRDTKFRRLEHAIQWTGLFLTQNPTWQPNLI